MRKTSLHFLWKDQGVPDRFPTAVSLHGHTHHSWENLRFLHTFKLPLPLIPAALRIAGWHHRRATGRPLSLARVLWTPPLAPDEAHRVETRQIQNLGLEPIVSLTDHDDIESGLALRRSPPGHAAPVSFEWTIPFGRTFFHLGVHHLPAGCARTIATDLYHYTAHPEPARLGELLEMLHGQADVLTVLNHPLWDEADIGAAGHRAALSALLSKYLDCVIAADQAEVETFFGNFVPRSRIKEAVNALLSARELSFVHVGNRSLIQITPAKAEPAVRLPKGQPVKR